MSTKMWIEAIRPKTLIASISPICIGSTLAYRSGSFNILTFLFTLMTGLLIQIGTNLANDYFDGIKGTDRERIGPVRAVASKAISASTMLKATFITFILSFVSSLFLIYQGGLIIAILMIIATVVGIGYTAGPFALAYIGLGDFVVLFGFGSLATSMTYFLHTHTLSLPLFLLGLAPGAISVMLLTINNLRDEHSDRKAGKNTLIVRFGPLFGKLEYSTMMLIAIFSLPCLSFFLGTHRFWIFFSLILPMALLANALNNDVKKAKSPQDYIPLLPKTGLFFYLYTIIFCLLTLL